MLDVQKPFFEYQIKTALYDGMYKAFMSMYGANSDNSNINQQMKSSIDQTAKVFAQTFVDGAGQSLVDAIDSYIRSIGITINQPIPSSSVLTTSLGPVSGNISILPANIQIN